MDFSLRHLLKFRWTSYLCSPNQKKVKKKLVSAKSSQNHKTKGPTDANRMSFTYAECSQVARDKINATSSDSYQMACA